MTAVETDNTPIPDSGTSPNDAGMTATEIAHRRAAAEDVIELLGRVSEYYETGEELYLWFTSPQPLLQNMTPAALVARGQTKAMLDMWDSIDAGTYI